MKVIRRGEMQSFEYDAEETDIRKVAQEFGHAEDSVELYTDSGKMTAIAVWFQGDKAYSYSYGGNFSEYPERRIYTYD